MVRWRSPRRECEARRTLARSHGDRDIWMPAMRAGLLEFTRGNEKAGWMLWYALERASTAGREGGRMGARRPVLILDSTLDGWTGRMTVGSR